jgi:hypothetical protein
LAASRNLSPEQRSQRGSLAAHAMHSQGKTNTQPARDKFDERFLDEVDPDRVLPEPERLRRAGHARKAYFARLAFLSSRARAKKAAPK